MRQALARVASCASVARLRPLITSHMTKATNKTMTMISIVYPYGGGLGQGGDLEEKIQRSTWRGDYQSLWEPVRTRSGCCPRRVSAPRAREILGCRVLAAENIAGTIRVRLLFAVLQTYAGE